LLPPPVAAGFGAGLLVAGAERVGWGLGAATCGALRVVVVGADEDEDEGRRAAANALAALARARATRARCALLSLSATKRCLFSLTAVACKSRARSSLSETAGVAAAAGLLDSVWRPSLKAKWKAKPAAMKTRITLTCIESRAVMVIAL
jgi:hypothetical protein